MKRTVIFFLAVGILISGAYVYTRFALKKPHYTPSKPKEQAEKPLDGTSVLDLRPKLIAKLQQLVAEGSGGLYQLSIHEIEPDILASTLAVKKVSLEADTVVLRKLDQLLKAPDDIFKVHVDSIMIDGLGIKDLLSKNSIDLKSIQISNPKIEVFHSAKAYNKNKPNDSSAFFQKLSRTMKHIAVGKIIVDNGLLLNHNLTKKKDTRFRGVKIKLTDLLMDSVTQCDKNRFCFSRNAEISFSDYEMITPGNLYKFKIGSVEISAARRTLTAKNIALQPLYDKHEFQKKIKVQTEWYDLQVPSLIFRDIYWWDIVNLEGFRAAEGDMVNASLKNYLDLSGPPDKPEYHNFPQQLLMQLPFPVAVEKFKIRNLSIAYEEFHPKSGKSGTLYFDRINTDISHITNIPEKIRRHKETSVVATALFMKQIPVKANIEFHMTNAKSGSFSAVLNMAGFNGTGMNNIAESMGMFLIKRGVVDSARAEIKGDDYNASGNVTLLYHNLHLTPLKKDSLRESGFKKKTIFSFIANAVVLKDENPSPHKEVRVVQGQIKRDPHGTFFNLIWKTVLVGILKTIGAPEKLAY